MTAGSCRYHAERNWRQWTLLEQFGRRGPLAGWTPPFTSRQRAGVSLRWPVFFTFPCSEDRPEGALFVPPIANLKTASTLAFDGRFRSAAGTVRSGERDGAQLLRPIMGAGLFAAGVISASPRGGRII